jgi:SAM-dependent methyltransferase
VSTGSAPTDRAFEAPDLIEVMDEAVNYNRFLVAELTRWANGARRLLDFGAGSGRFALRLAEQGFEMHAVEPDAALRAAMVSGGIRAVAALDDLEPEPRFDGIYSVNVLEHVEDDLSLLRALRTRLVPGGRLFSYVPAFRALFSANDVRVGHVRRYRRGELLERTESAGFRVVSARYVDALGFPAGLWYRFFGNRDGGLDVGAVRLYDRVVFPVSRQLDRLAQGFVGKNLLVTAVSPAGDVRSGRATGPPV